MVDSLKNVLTEEKKILFQQTGSDLYLNTENIAKTFITDFFSIFEFTKALIFRRQFVVYFQEKKEAGVINDPLGQTHSFANSEHCFRLKFVLFWKVGTDGLHVQKQWSLPAREFGSASWIKKMFCVIDSTENGETAERIGSRYLLWKHLFSPFVFKVSILIQRWQRKNGDQRDLMFPENVYILIHSDDQQSRPVVIIVLAHFVRPSVRPSPLFKI